MNTGTVEENRSCQLIYCLTHEPNQFQKASISRNTVCWHAAEMLLQYVILYTDSSYSTEHFKDASVLNAPKSRSLRKGHLNKLENIF